MKTCTFFGHHDTPDCLKGLVKECIEKLITEHGVEQFYVGHQGQFDAYVRSALRQLKLQYPHIRYAVVLAYMPGKAREGMDYSDTMYPEGLEFVPRRFAIDRRNRWMIQRSDYVVHWACHEYRNAMKYVRKAERMGKTVVWLTDAAFWDGPL